MTTCQIIDSDASEALKSHSLVTLLPLLRHLSDGQWQSGVSLGEKLGVSRAAIWKQLKKLDDYGIALESHSQKGYRLGNGIDWLNANAILAEVSANQECIGSLQCFRVLESTNQYLLDNWKAFINSPDEHLAMQVCTAEWQSGGRGRRGKQWVSPFAGNICLSVGWAVSGGAAALEGISLVAGCVLAETLEVFGFKDIQLKWPNDLLVNGQKLAGLLVEIRGDIAGDCFCVLGVGLNISIPDDHSGAIDQAWTDLERLAQEQSILCPSRNQVIGAFLERLVNALQTHKQQGFAAFSQEWQLRDAFLNKAVRFQQGLEWQDGIAKGINNQGALKIRVDDREILLHGGEISVRAQ